MSAILHYHVTEHFLLMLVLITMCIVIRLYSFFFQIQLT